jgi:hypothetical protein
VEKWRVVDGSIAIPLAGIGSIFYLSTPSILSTLSIKRIRYPFLVVAMG